MAGKKWADTIYYNGSIITMVGEEPSYVEALAVMDGTIIFAGSQVDAFKFGNAKMTSYHDLNNKCLLPGFIDGHSHYMNSLFVADQACLYPSPSGPGDSVNDIIAVLKKFVKERGIPEGDDEWIMGYGYDDTVMPDNMLLTSAHLSEAFPNNPVRIDHVSMHGAVFNVKALDLLELKVEAVDLMEKLEEDPEDDGPPMFDYDYKTECPAGGVIVRDGDDYGLFMETAFLPVMSAGQGIDDEVEASRKGQMMYAAAGITTAHEGATHKDPYELMLRVSNEGANIIDIVCYPFMTDYEDVLKITPLEEWCKYKNRLKLGGVKITLDGSPQGKTAWFTTPYLKGGPDATFEGDWYGEPTIAHELAYEYVRDVYYKKLPVICHTNGDAAIDFFIKAYRRARNSMHDAEPHAWNATTIHTQFLRKDQIPEFVELNIRPSLYTLHTYYFADAHIENRGEEQAHYISPMRDVIDAGMRPTNHTDAVVAPLDQMMMLWSAVNRKSRSGEDIGVKPIDKDHKGQCVTAYEGLKAMTIWGAEQHEDDALKGTLEKGKLADLVILDQDPLKVKKEEIKNIKVVMTIKEGKKIYERPEDSAPPSDTTQKKKRTKNKAKKNLVHVCDLACINNAANKEWELKKLNGKKVTVDPAPTLKFAKDRLNGFGGVNMIWGKYAILGNRVIMGKLSRTVMTGSSDAMEVEKEYSEALSSVNSFNVTEKKLQLLCDGETVAVFKAK
eukprot:CAMPEP_0185726568 /NCGR_PEP_ID=MMETSP1171-20130828/2511_1 /TAXON_ID=374046 /ORGANISM="Helicotheca tamensis, Strain CCMP826" /LENGTH=725 /DNA_ID=CAMNT_0028394951 /DNA_START=124 /DNA_END=2301 /DNA_ORIENTATION=+